MIMSIKRIFKKRLYYWYLLKHKNFNNLEMWSQEDERRLKFYGRFIKPDDLVFDVGANMGNRTKIFLKLNAKVVAFEPQKMCAKFLESAFKSERNFTLIRKALGAKDGEAEMFIANEHTISTLSKHWVTATKKSGRFRQNTWNKRQLVEITTLDNMIKQFGIPSFIKIDVEGYEYEVLSGISIPIDYISIEFAAENINNTYKCIEHMNSLSNVLFQIVKGEETIFYFPEWISGEELKNNLSDIINQDSLAWGDIYIKMSRSGDKTD
jgi:FkbM family methyltransferase